MTREVEIKESVAILLKKQLDYQALTTVPNSQISAQTPYKSGDLYLIVWRNWIREMLDDSGQVEEHRVWMNEKKNSFKIGENFT